MVEPLKVLEKDEKKEVVCKKRKVLAPWKFQEGYERRPNRNKAQRFETGGESHETNLGQKGQGSNEVTVTDFERFNRKLDNGEISKPNYAKQGSDGENKKGENSNNVKGSRHLYKAVATWRFQPYYRRHFSEEHKLRRKSFRSPYPQRKYPSSVRVSASCEFSVDSGLDLSSQKKGFSNYSSRDSVISSLREFQSIYQELLVKEETQRVPGSGTRCARHWVARHWVALRKYKEKSSYDDTKKFIGEVPGTLIGDVFNLRCELCVVGLHRQYHNSVDSIQREEVNVAISVVSYGNIADLKKNNNIDIVEFSGSSVVGSNAMLDGSNLALVKSLETKTPVRFIYGFVRNLSSAEMLRVRTKRINMYIYCGLYTVEKYWRKRSDDGTQYFYVFRLQRVAGQADLDIMAILEAKKSESFLFPTVYMVDLSFGKEKVPVSVVNFINREKLPFFKYITGLRTLVLRDPTPPVGCGCINGCSHSVRCACAVKNGGELPFNDNGRIVEAKPLVFECGPACKCPPTCYNRVSQHGLKFRLQVFKTKQMGWGVRSLEFIPSGSFVCEYVAELISDEEAQRRTNDEYLFSIGNNYYDEKLWEGLKNSIPALKRDKSWNNLVKNECFTMDASEFGNFSRFINHSCTPNLYAQNLLYDHDNIRMPRIMFFACEDIQPMEELAYHYNYSVDEVHDANGNVKKKQCFCGTKECSGWLY